MGYCACRCRCLLPAVRHISACRFGRPVSGDATSRLATPDPPCDNIVGMPWGEVELEPEVRDWLEGLDDQRWAQAMFHLDLLEERGALLG